MSPWLETLTLWKCWRIPPFSRRQRIPCLTSSSLPCRFLKKVRKTWNSWHPSYHQSFAALVPIRPHRDVLAYRVFQHQKMWEIAQCCWLEIINFLVRILVHWCVNFWWTGGFWHVAWPILEPCAPERAVVLRSFSALVLCQFHRATSSNSCNEVRWCSSFLVGSVRLSMVPGKTTNSFGPAKQILFGSLLVSMQWWCRLVALEPMTVLRFWPTSANCGREPRMLFLSWPVARSVLAD
mmetsp:Transcript_87270/g.138460  ORF Transcript_87270/g.138460 Transcript_87270/m.138460 type:complete len:237 (-) Transcript_87270:525-1235(-)